MELYKRQRTNYNKNILFILWTRIKISEIAQELEIGESNIKNKIYRTLKELKKYLGEEVNKNG